MDFKPTLWKSITSLISGILVNYLLVGNVKVLCDFCIEGRTCNCPQPTWIEYAFNPVPLVISIIVIAIVYVIWSLIQKK